MPAPRPDAAAGVDIDENRRAVPPIRVLIVLPLLAPLLIDVVAGGLMAFLGLLGSGMAGALYGFVLFLFWLPFCYLLLGPLFLLVGALSLWLDRQFEWSGLRGRLGATVMICGICVGVWLGARGVVAWHKQAPFRFGIDGRTAVASLVFIVTGSTGCWWLEPWVLRAAKWIVAVWRSSRPPCSAS